MAYSIDLSAALTASLADKEIRRSMDERGSRLDERYVRARVERSKEEIRRELSSQVDEVDAAEARIAAVEASIDKLNAPRSADEFLFFTLSLGLLIALVLGVVSIFTRGPWNALVSWLAASFQFGPQAFVTWGFVAVLIVLVGNALAWQRIVKPRQAARIRANAGIEAATVRAKATRQAADERLSALVMQYVRQVINDASQQFFQATLWLEPPPPAQKAIRVTSGQGLSEVTNPANEVPTDVRRDVLELLETLPGGSIGVSGPRGAGKSTLLWSLCGARQKLNGREGVSLYTASPVDYDARDFLLHLFASLCRQVLKINGAAEDRGDFAEAPRSRLGRRLTAVQGDVGVILFFLGGLMALVGLFIGIVIAAASGGAEAAPGAADAGAQTAAQATSLIEALELKPGPLLLWGLVALAAGAMLVVSEVVQRNTGAPSLFELLKDPDGRKREKTEPLIVKRCREELRDIRFQRTFTSGFSGGLKVPVGLEFGGTAGESIAQRQESLPELVERFRDFVMQVADQYGKVLIGIDELDKLKSTEAAETFLNEIKSIFNLAGCFYLISVSENAVTSFERRGLPFRDVFDSAFDEIHYIDYLGYESARLLLARRVLNLPEPFLSMCFVFSGGLPRDLIRATRSLLAVAEELEAGKADPAAVVCAYAQREVLAKLRASAAAARILASVHTAPFLVAITALEVMPFAGPAFDQALERQAGALPATSTDAHDKKLRELQNELFAFFKYLRLCVDVFSRLDAEPAWRRALQDGLFADLARARSGFEASVAVADARIDAVRAKWQASLKTPVPAPATPPPPQLPPPKQPPIDPLGAPQRQDAVGSDDGEAPAKSPQPVHSRDE